jgi:mannose-6-phosphate isomerase
VFLRGISLSDIKQLLPLNPTFVEKVWGGKKLGLAKGRKGDRPLGETWEVSNLPEGPSYYGDTPLSDMTDEKQLPYLIKFIDTSDNLSVQVHPDDLYASAHENSKGKTECWIILDADEGAGIYLGTSDGVSRESFSEVLKSNGEIDKLLSFYKVERGDFFFVPSGSIHAIGTGVTLAEVQQRCGITYRVWDWNRLGMDGKPRQLHVEQALEVIRFDSDFNSIDNFQVHRNIFSSKKMVKLAEHQDFRVTVYNVDRGDSVELSVGSCDRFSSIICLDGKLAVSRGAENHGMTTYQSLLLPNNTSDSVRIVCEDASSFLWVE